MIRVSHYIADFFVAMGIRDVFLVSGGGMMFLLDGLACQKELNVICTHHEQAAAMAGVAHAKLLGKPAVVYVTTGCGSTNAITGLVDAWQDSVPVIFISGQSKRSESIRGTGISVRQLGVQEVDILPIVKSITKYSVYVDTPEKIGFYLQQAWEMAISGRPGPVWLDIPLDVQASEIDCEVDCEVFSKLSLPGMDKPSTSEEDLLYIHECLAKAKRPIVLVGQGVRLACAESLLQQLLEKYNLPMVTSRLGIDVIPTDHSLYIGRIGNKGDRAGNFSIQNADFILAIGSRLSISSTGHDYKNFGRDAIIVVVDIDPQEHAKNTVCIDRLIHSDSFNFIFKLLHFPAHYDYSEWAEICQRWRAQFSLFLPKLNKPKQKINMYRFMEVLNALLPEDAIVISDAGSAFYIVSQSLRIRRGQRYITSGGQADMGFGLPALVGASVASGRGAVVGIIGDGSFQMNIQELQTLIHNRLPAKIFVMNNDGYLSIRAMQMRYFNGRILGTDERSGVSFPSIKRIAAAYGIPYVKISRTGDLEKGIHQTLNMAGLVLCEVVCLPEQDIVSVSSLQRSDGVMVSKPLEDMYPFLPRPQFLSEMIIDPLDESK